MATILVIDGEELVLNLVSEVLTRARYKVITAHDGPEAMSILRAHASAVDVVIAEITSRAPYCQPRRDDCQIVGFIRKYNPNMRIV